MSKKLICLTAVGVMLAFVGSAGAQVPAGWAGEHIGGGVDGSFASTDSTVTITGDGSDIWNNADAFQYMYKELSGDGALVARVVSNGTGTDAWAKGGVMIRQNNTPGSAHIEEVITGGNGGGSSFQWRMNANGGSGSGPGGTNVAPPYWVKIERVGNSFTGSVSADGKTWTQQGTTQTIAMKDPVLIGLCVTSHVNNTLRTFTFDNVAITGTAFLKARFPKPADGGTEVTDPTFTWTPGPGAFLNHVYCGMDPNLTAKGDDQGAMWPVTNGQGMFYYMAGLIPGTKYYWRVDELDATNTQLSTGDVWSFTTAPLEAHNPSPADGMQWRQTNLTLSWTTGQGNPKHRVYLGTDQANVTARDASTVQPDQTTASLVVSNLQANSTYYWCVDEIDATGKVSAKGAVWSFTTIDANGGLTLVYYKGTALTGAPLKVTTVPSVNWSLSTGVPDPVLPASNWSARYTAFLTVPVSGAWTLYGASDDGERLYLDGVRLTNAWVGRGETEDASPVQNLVAGQQYLIVMEYYQGGGGSAARLRWAGPGYPKEIIPPGALQIPQIALAPVPGDAAVEVAELPTLSWTPAPKALAHTVYLGTDQTKVAAGDKSTAQAPSITPSFTPAAALKWNTTYYWRVDETLNDGTTSTGQVWSFTTANWIVIQPAQVPLVYDNVLSPYMTSLSFDVGDLTKNGVTDLDIRYAGVAARRATPDGVGVAYNDANGVYKLTAVGSDIWNANDQFEYAYKALTGDGTMVARVTGYQTNAGDSTWAKGGVMIRQSLYAGSTFALTPITNGSANGYSYQFRLVQDATPSNSDGAAPAIKPPYWVKIERKGDAFSAYYSPDGTTWTQQGTTQTIVMKDPVYIGLAACPHSNSATNVTMKNTFTFDNVSTTGNVTPEGAFTTAAAIALGNDAAPLFVTIQDKAGKMATVIGTNTAATNVVPTTGSNRNAVMDLWRVPMSSFTGVDLKNAAKLFVGVGNGTAGGWGIMQFADIRIVKPVTLPDPAAVDITAKGDPLVGEPNDGVNTGGSTFGWPAAEAPANVIDNDINTKFLDFKGEVQSTGFRVTPSAGATVVTGLTFTSANDAGERDPITWELYGSNAGINGPWALIASGTIDDFSRPNFDWPAKWKTVTPIGFANAMPYTSYKVMFPAVKRPAAANSMQIAEVELLGTLAPAGPVVVWVSFSGDDNVPSNGAKGVGFTAAVDKGYTDLLKANGYNVVRYVQTAKPNVDMLNQAGLVIASRCCASTSFQNAAADLWNSVTAPMIVTNGYLSRKNRMGFNSGSTGPQDTTGDIKLAVSDPNHPIFKGVTLTKGVMDNAFAGIATYPTDKTKAYGISVTLDPANADGKTLATISEASGQVTAGALMIAEWQAGTKAIHDGGAGTDVLGGHRLVLLTGSRENGGKSAETAGMYDLYDDGAKIFLNAVAYMLVK